MFYISTLPVYSFFSILRAGSHGVFKNLQETNKGQTPHAIIA